MAGEYRIVQMMDIIEPDTVEIMIADDGPNHHKIWVNIDSICHLRAQRIKKLDVTKVE